MGKHKKRRAAQRSASADMSSPKFERQLIRNNCNKHKPKQSSPNPNHNEKIAERRLQMPKVYRSNYDQAMTGRSRRAAIKAFCLECVCWHKEEVRLCSSPACPLFPYRPYRISKKASQGASFTQECEKE
ncbi:MAG: hypothetical protein ACYSSP_03540 [Planctomycetota bacterium]|jgi:hypothetical protein